MDSKFNQLTLVNSINLWKIFTKAILCQGEKNDSKKEEYMENKTKQLTNQ